MQARSSPVRFPASSPAGQRVSSALCLRILTSCSLLRWIAENSQDNRIPGLTKEEWADQHLTVGALFLIALIFHVPILRLMFVAAGSHFQGTRYNSRYNFAAGGVGTSVP